MPPLEKPRHAPAHARTWSSFGWLIPYRITLCCSWFLGAGCQEPTTSSPEHPPDADGSASEDATEAASKDTGTSDSGSDCLRFYRSGHGDLYVDHSPESGPSLWLRSELEPGAGELLYDPHEPCIEVSRATFEMTSDFGGRPAGEQWDFLGVAAAQPFWYLPQEPRAGVPWLGLAARAIPFEHPASEGFTLSLVDVEAPPGGVFSIWISDVFGEPIPLLSTREGPWELHVASGAHVHVNWGFSVAGRYDLGFRVEGASNDGGAPETASATFRFEVQP